jgi:hypothetical protein
VECGALQGSVLGPLFILLYVNDMARESGELGLLLFADDTNLYVVGQDPAGLLERVNKGLGELGRWFRCNKLKKTEYVSFAGARPPEVLLDVLVIERAQLRAQGS